MEAPGRDAAIREYAALLTSPGNRGRHFNDGDGGGGGVGGAAALPLFSLSSSSLNRVNQLHLRHYHHPPPPSPPERHTSPTVQSAQGWSQRAGYEAGSYTPAESRPQRLAPSPSAGKAPLQRFHHYHRPEVGGDRRVDGEGATGARAAAGYVHHQHHRQHPQQQQQQHLLTTEEGEDSSSSSSSRQRRTPNAPASASNADTNAHNPRQRYSGSEDAAPAHSWAVRMMSPVRVETRAQGVAGGTRTPKSAGVESTMVQQLREILAMKVSSEHDFNWKVQWKLQKALMMMRGAGEEGGGGEEGRRGEGGTKPTPNDESCASEERAAKVTSI